MKKNVNVSDPKYKAEFVIFEKLILHVVNIYNYLYIYMYICIYIYIYIINKNKYLTLVRTDGSKEIKKI